jgi:hypothetical protein
LKKPRRPLGFRPVMEMYMEQTYRLVQVNYNVDIPIPNQVFVLWRFFIVVLNVLMLSIP